MSEQVDYSAGGLDESRDCKVIGQATAPALIRPGSAGYPNFISAPVHSPASYDGN